MSEQDSNDAQIAEIASPNMRSSLASLLGDLNHAVFWPPFLLLLAAVAVNLIDPQNFLSYAEGARDCLVINFGWLFSLCAFASVLLCGWICCSDFGRIRIGGRNAKPLMSRWNWFSITICTTIAVGIMFWATAEPIFHYHQPPAGRGIEPQSPAAATFALSTMYLHWTFTPYAIYCVGSLMFAFAFYNMKQEFSISSMLAPLIGTPHRFLANAVDAICLYCLVAGMAAALGAGILSISGGLENLGFTAALGLERGKFLWALIALAIVTTFVISSTTGLMHGIRILSDLNTRALVVLAVFAFICGPTVFLLDFGIESFGVYLNNFFAMNLFNGTVSNDQWSHSWTVFYWAVWLAWTPITACFLGQISYGRTVREFMMINFIFPSLFSVAWMAIFSGIALHMEMNGADLFSRIKVSTESASYAVFETFPLAGIIIVFYLASTFICFVTSADSNTTAMTNISSSGISPENPEGNPWLKIIWGVSVGTISWVMISYADVEGIRILSSLGGFPAAILISFVVASLVKVVIDPQRYNLVDRSDTI